MFLLYSFSLKTCLAVSESPQKNLVVNCSFYMGETAMSIQKVSVLPFITLAFLCKSLGKILSVHCFPCFVFEIFIVVVDVSCLRHLSLILFRTHVTHAYDLL